MTFSIIIPVYNRATEIQRSLRSCLAQISDDAEVIVVDDASTDCTRASVAPFLEDRRVRLLCRRANGGEWAARADGVRSASGEWVAFLDSDDELLPDGWATILYAVRQYKDNFDRIGFSYRYPNGSRSPEPAIDRPVEMGFSEYLTWSSMAGRSDAFWVVRRATFDHAPIPDGRRVHALYHFSFASQFATLLLPFVVAAVHTESGNRLTAHLHGYSAEVRKQAMEEIRNREMILIEYGPEMLRQSPALHQRFSRACLVACVVAGKRSRAFRKWIEYVRQYPGIESVGLGVLIVAGARTTQITREYRSRRMRNRQTYGSRQWNSGSAS